MIIILILRTLWIVQFYSLLHTPMYLIRDVNIFVSISSVLLTRMSHSQNIRNLSVLQRTFSVESTKLAPQGLEANSSLRKTQFRIGDALRLFYLLPLNGAIANSSRLFVLCKAKVALLQRSLPLRSLILLNFYIPNMQPLME